MKPENRSPIRGTSRQAEETYLADTLGVIQENVKNYSQEVERMQKDIDEMLEHYHDNDAEVYTILSNTITMNEHMKRALLRNQKAEKKPYFGRIVYHDEALNRQESLYIGRGGIARDTTHWMVVDWRAPVANAYYENGLGKCSYPAPGGKRIRIDLQLKRTYEIENAELLDYYDTEVISNDELLTRYLAKNKQAVLGEIIATIQKEQNDIIRKSPYHNIIVQGVAGSGKTTVAMHRISYILYNYAQRFRPEDFYIVGSNRILLDYITGVLPDLDVYGIRQMTMEQLFVRLLYEDWDDKKYSISDTGRLGARGGIRGTGRWFRELEEYCRKMEWEVIPRESVYLNPRQFVEGFKDGKTGVFDETEGKKADPSQLIELVSKDVVERYIRQNPAVSIQSKIDMLNDRLMIKIKDEFLGKGIKYTDAERKAIRKAYRGLYGGKVWKRSIYELYRDFLKEQREKGQDVDIPDKEFDVYDLAALAYLYKRVKETEVISEAHHIVIDEAQDFGMMAYCVLDFCIKDCTYTVMGDVSQNIHFGYGLNDWEELRRLLLSGEKDSFGILKKSYRNTVEISEFAIRILDHGNFSRYPVEPIIRHGEEVLVQQASSREEMLKDAADRCRRWQEKGLGTIAVVCRDRESARRTEKELGELIPVRESDLESAVFDKGIMVLPVEYTKGLEFDAVLIMDPTREEYPKDDGHAKLLYVAATRALHELCVLHTGDLTGLIADPVEEKRPGAGEPGGGRMEAKRLKSNEVKADRMEKAVFTRESQVAEEEHVRTDKRLMLKKRISIVRNPLPEAEQKERPQNGKEKRLEQTGAVSLAFGDMPPTEKLRPAGHSRIDLAARWVTREQDGLYIQSRYGVLRLSPVGSGIIRVTFARGQKILDGFHPGIAVRRTERAWMYKDSGSAVELMTDELCLRLNKASGAIQYMSRDKKILLAERNRECRQLDAGPGLAGRCYLFLDWTKEKEIYGLGAGKEGGIKLRGAARYITPGAAGELPLIISDQGYGILMAAQSPVMCCDIPAYGSYLSAENELQLDFYFIGGKKQSTVMNAYAYLCGKL